LLLERYAEPLRSAQQRVCAFVEDEQRGPFAASGGALDANSAAIVDFPVPARALDQRARAPLESAAEHRVERLELASNPFAARWLPVLGGNQAQEDFDAAAANAVIVVAATEIAAPKFRDAGRRRASPNSGTVCSRSSAP
jgi:hypothetical protein